MNHVKVLKRWELVVAWQWSRDEELEFTRCAQQAVTRVNAQFLANTLNHTIDFGFEIRRVVDHVEIGMTDPGGCSSIVQLTCMINTFRATRVFL